MKLNKPLIQFSGPPEGGGGHVGVARQQHKQTKVKPQARGGQNHNWKQQFPHLLPAVFHYAYVLAINLRAQPF